MTKECPSSEVSEIRNFIWERWGGGEGRACAINQETAASFNTVKYKNHVPVCW